MVSRNEVNIEYFKSIWIQFTTFPAVETTALLLTSFSDLESMIDLLLTLLLSNSTGGAKFKVMS